MSEFAKFALAGGFAAGVNVVMRYLLDFIMSYSAAIVIAYLIAMMVAYILSRQFVFSKTNRSVTNETLRFAIVNVFAIVLVWGTSIAFAKFIFPWINFTWRADDIAHMIGVAVPAISSYLGHKYFTFRGVRS